MRYHRDGTESRGREAISRIAGRFRNEYSTSGSASADKQIRDAYNTFHHNFQPLIGHYFRNLYQILRFINDSLAGVEDKKLYGRLVRAQLSSDELFLLFYNCLSEVGVKKFKPLVEEFAMLQHVPKESLIHPEDMALYDQRAFGEAE